jgi:outer membrane cobalamin receptor
VTIREPGYLTPGPSFPRAVFRTHRRENTPKRRPVKVRPVFLFLTAIFFFSTSVLAGPVTGRVVDPDGRPVAGATVMLVGGAAPLRTAVTNARGEFTIASPDDGRYELRVAAEGFRAEPVPVEATSGSRDLGEVRVAVSAVTESVVVSAAQVETPLSQAAASVTVVSGTELTARQIHTVADALRAVPGMTVIRYGGIGALTNVFPRGGESDYTLVLVDGIQANTFGGDYDFGHLSTENIERVEVVRGPQSALFGSNAMGSVVRIVTRRGGPIRVAASFEGGSFGTSRASTSAAGSRGAWEWGGSAERLSSDGHNGKRTAAGEAVSNDDYTRHLGSFAGGWRGDSGALVRGDIRVSRDERGFPGPFGTNPVGAYFGIDTASRGTNDRLLASVSGLFPLGSRVRVHAQLTHGRLDSDFASAFGPSGLVSRRVGARFQTDITRSDALDFSAGVDVQRERTGSTFITGVAGEVPVKRHVAGYFAEGRWRSGQRLFVTAGVRLDDIERDAIEADQVGFSARPALPADSVVSANPKISAAWFARTAAGSFTKLRAGAGTGIRPPNGFEIASTDNPYLKPERSRSAEFGVDQAVAGGRGLIEATAFFNNYDDLIVAVGSFRESSAYRTDNISNARSRGLELAGTARARAGATMDVQVRASYTWLDTTILAVDRAGAAPPPFEVGDPLLRRPRHQFSTEALVTSGRATAFLQGGGRARTVDIEPSLGTFHPFFFDAPGYQVWNAGGSFRVHRSVEVFGRIDNLFDRAYEEALGFPGHGRGAFAGLRVATGR